MGLGLVLKTLCVAIRAPIVIGISGVWFYLGQSSSRIGAICRLAQTELTTAVLASDPEEMTTASPKSLMYSDGTKSA
jgi:hypothetical protein